jgi:pimeloyl-ACP methyl ester carboxylesterase
VSAGVLLWRPMTALTASGIAFDDRGRGEPALLFLPGWCGPRTVFGPLADRLEGSFRTLAVDWRGHGESKTPEGEFGSADLVDDAVAVIDQSGAASVVPVALSHAGWVAIELRRRLGPERVPRLVLVDWMVLGAPPQFLDALAAMANPQTTRAVVDQITAMWVAGLDLRALNDYVASMAAFPDDMWARAARAITASFEQFGAPLETIAALDPPPPTLHLYAQPPDPEYLEAQRAVAADHPWFEVQRLNAASHFPTVEVPDAIAGHLEKFVVR